MDIEADFTELGGTFCIPYSEMRQKLSRIKAIIFDWDGVFNDGTKDHQGSSNFSEVDAMGTNLLRFSRWLSQNAMPFIAIMSGEKNLLSFQFAQREHFHQCYFKVADKKQAFDHFIKIHALKPEEIVFVFDDVLDLPVAAIAGLRVMVNHNANILFRKYVTDRNLADYITSSTTFAVRETCELLMGITGNFEQVLQERSAFSETYRNYLHQRQNIPTEYFTITDQSIGKVEV